jgi:nucleoside-diphosphate-sugar epimerase
MSLNSKIENLLKGKKILVTGGCGFIGSHICERLVKIGAQVAILDDLSSGKIKNIALIAHKIKFFQKDLRDDAGLVEALSGVDMVCHQAALRSVPKSMKNPLVYNDVNVSGSLKLFIKAKDLGIKKIVCASSSSVYGERTDFPEKETDVPAPVSPYAATKLIVEQYSGLFNSSFGMDIINLRYFNVFGPKQSLEDEYAVVVPKFIDCLLKNIDAPVYGDGLQERDFTYIDNVVDANLCALAGQDLGEKIFNVACGRPQSVNSLYAGLKEIIGGSSNIKYLPLRPGDILKTHADISRMENILGLNPSVDFKEGLKRTVEWVKSVQGSGFNVQR